MIKKLLSKLLCFLGIHKWKPIGRWDYCCFMGEKFPKFKEFYRICERCGRVETNYGVPLDEIRKMILLKKIEDMGYYYELKYKGLIFDI